jgi:hypothetical protein
MFSDICSDPARPDGPANIAAKFTPPIHRLLMPMVQSAGMTDRPQDK